MTNILSSIAFVIFIILGSYEAVIWNRFIRKVHRTRVMKNADVKQAVIQLLKISLIIGAFSGIFLTFTIHSIKESGYIILFYPLVCIVGWPLLSLLGFSLMIISFRRFYKKENEMV